MSNSLLRITDGTNSVDLLDTKSGFLLNEWKPAFAPFKGGGVWKNSPLADGRRLSLRMFDNAVETFDLKIHGKGNQDTTIAYVQDLVTLLEKAIAYWTSSWQGTPVWIEARGPQESNIRYAVIKSYTIESFGNPYAQPFFNICNKIAMDDFTLIIERDHWQDIEPGSDTCVEADTLQEFDNSLEVLSDSFPVVASGDDMYISMDGMAGWIDNVRNWVGITVPDDIRCESGLRFQDITIPQGAVIHAAYLEVVASSTGSDDDCDMDFVIYGEATDDAAAWGAVFDTGPGGLFTDYRYRKSNQHTDSVCVYRSPADSWHTDAAVEYIYGLEAVVQEIVDRSGWVSGNALALFVGYSVPEGCSAADYSRVFYSFDDLTNAAPILHIYYSVDAPTTSGREATCTGSTFVANKHNRAQITHMYHYDDSLTVFSANLIGAAKPTSLLPAAPADDDAIYIGVNTDLRDSGPFDSFVTDIETPSADILYTYYYCTNAVGPVWTQLVVYGETQFAVAGEHLAYWVQPTNWVACDVNGVTGYWIKIVIDVDEGGAPTIPTQDNRDIYSVITPFLNIDADEVPGEIAALARIKMDGQEFNNTYATDTVMVALRSLSRGENFTPYINISDEQNPLGLVLSWNVTYGAMSNFPNAPTGRLFTWDQTGASTEWVVATIVSMTSNIAHEYRGVFHAYLRIQTAAAPEDFKVKLGLRSSYGNAWVYTDEIRPIDSFPAGSMQCLDLGTVDFGNNRNFSESDIVEGAAIAIMYYQDTADETITFIHDLILMPVDEWAGIYHVDNPQYPLKEGVFLDIDATGNPRGTRALLRAFHHGYVGLPPYEPYVIGEWNRQSRGGPLLQANTNQRLWFFCFPQNDNSFSAVFHNKYEAHVYRASRYLSMRGIE